MQVLLVEDSNSDIRLITEAIKDGKIIDKCHIVKDGEEAMQFLNKQNGYSNAPSPDMILLDLNLPKKNGLEVLQELKNTPSLQKIPVIIVTCSNDKDNIRKCYSLQANCYLVKPLEFSEFEDLIKTIESFWGKIAALPKAN